MKKIFAIFTTLMLLASLAAFTVSADDNGVYTTLEPTYEYPAQFEYAEICDFEWSEDYQGMHSASMQDAELGFWCDYVYLKQYGADNITVDEPYVMVEFEIEETGTYDFLIETMALNQYDTMIPRSGLVQIDDGDKYYIVSNYESRTPTMLYFEGITERLEAGTHKMTVYLAADFDDATVKSIFFDCFSYVMIADADGNPVDPTESKPENADPITEAPTTEQTTEPTTEAPTTATPDDDGRAEVTEKATEEEKTAEKGGCGSMVSGGIAAMVLITAAAGMAFVKKEN